MRKTAKYILLLVFGAVIFSGCNTWAQVKKPAVNPETDNRKVGAVSVSNSVDKQQLLGGLEPDKALQYMKSKKNLVIVEVNTAQWKLKNGFQGAMWIPHDEMAERFKEIPKDRPVILHCGRGVVSVPAYKILCANRKDIPEISYIAGVPPVAEYNAWLKSN